MIRSIFIVALLLLGNTILGQSNLRIGLKDIKNDTTIKDFKIINLYNQDWSDSNEDGIASLEIENSTARIKIQVSHILYESVVIECSPWNDDFYLTLFTKRRGIVDNSGKKRKSKK